MLWKIHTAIILLNFLSFPTTAQESFVQFNAGYGLVRKLDFGGTLGIEIKTRSSKRFTYSLNYNYYKVSGGATYNNPNGTTTILVKSSSRYLSLMANWYPIKSIKKPFSYLYIGAGVTYFDFSYFDSVWSGGPGVRGNIGFQYPILKKLFLGANFDIVMYYETIHLNRGFDIIYDGGRLNISIGYRIY